MAIVRQRLNARVVDGKSRSVRRVQVLHGLAPLVSYIRTSLPQASRDSLTASSLAEVVLELSEHAAERTRLMAKFEGISNSESEWQLVEDGLWNISGGGGTPAPRCSGLLPSLSQGCGEIAGRFPAGSC